METAKGASIVILSRGGDVWAHRVLVFGESHGAAFTSMKLVCNGRDVPFSPRTGFFEVEVPLEDGKNVVHAVGVTHDGGVVASEPVEYMVRLGKGAYGRDLPPVTEARPSDPPEDVRLYGVCVHLLSKDGLRGIEAKLDAIKALGCNAVWMNPTFPTEIGGHGYDVCDYFDVRPDYGTIEDMRSLTRAAHERGMRILLDLVPNHTSYGHPYFKDAVEHGRKSRYIDFYHWMSEGVPRRYFNWEHLPNLNFENPEVRTMIMEVGRFWVENVGVDGFRIDVVWGILERRREFWREWVESLRRMYPHVLLIAEGSVRWSEYFASGMDAAYDWDNGFLPAWRGLFDDPEEPAVMFHKALTAEGKGFHPDALAVRFIDNNDTGPRFIAKYGREKARLAALLVCTLPGIPLVYLGQENGAVFEPYRSNDVVEPGKDTELEELYRRLLALRRAEPALTSRKWERLDVETGAERLYAYLRWADGATPYAVVVNFGGNAERVKVRIDQGWLKSYRSVSAGARLADAVSGREGAVTESHLEVDLPAWSGAVFAL